MFHYEQHRSNKSEYLYHQFDVNLCFQSHLHRSLEFIYVEEGVLEMQINGHPYTLTDGQCALILPGQIHSYYTTDYSHSYLCVFSSDYVYDFYTGTVGKHSPNPTFKLESPECIALLNTPGINRFRVKEALYSIVGQFLSKCSLQSIEEDSKMNTLEKVVTYVQEHFCESLSLQEMATTLGYHYNYLSSYLNEHLGMHFSAFVNLYRIDYACDLLSQSDLAVTQIATQCGFDTVRSFNRNFQKVQNMTPQQFRQEKRLTVAAGSTFAAPAAVTNYEHTSKID